MLKKKDWFLLILLPLMLSWGLDQATKLWGLKFEDASYMGPFSIQLVKNYGMMMGTGMNIPEIYRVSTIAAVGFFLLYVFFMIQYLTPIKSKVFRIGLSVFAGSVIGNITDRVAYGYVVDFIQLNGSGLRTGVFNIADVLQWFGVASLIWALFSEGEILWPMNERRGRVWIDPSLQWRYCLMLAGTAGLFSLLAAGFFHVYLQLSLGQGTFLEPGFQTNSLNSFKVLFGVISLTFVISLFFIGRILSHRIAGPIRAFESYLQDLLNQKNPRSLQLRNHDEFKFLEDLAGKFQEQFHDKWGADPLPLEKGRFAPPLKTVTVKNGQIDLSDYSGQKVWLCLYRFSTCVLCALHLSEILTNLALLKESGIQVILVYEYPIPEKTDPREIEVVQQIQDSPFPVIIDPEKKIYKAFKATENAWTLFHPQVWINYRKARKRKFNNAALYGTWGLIPAHILIDKQGKIFQAHYGKHVDDHIPWTDIEKFMKS